jgi:hypothetical protein
MSNRNLYREIYTADSKLRETIYDRRFLEDTSILSRVAPNAPTDEELRNDLTHIQRVYIMGDRLYKFAYEYYGDVDYWWIIAWYNNKPTDAHFNIGDIVYIPRELDVAIRIATRER